MKIIKRTMTLKNVENLIFDLDNNSEINISYILQRLSKKDLSKLNDMFGKIKDIAKITTYKFHIASHNFVNSNIANKKYNFTPPVSKQGFIDSLLYCHAMYTSFLNDRIHTMEEDDTLSYLKSIIGTYTPSICSISINSLGQSITFTHILKLYFILIMKNYPAPYFFTSDVNDKNFYLHRLLFIECLLDIFEINNN